ncbi:AdoMet-dependent rRNA methyltransferase spb1, partial [Linum grandiflorum]
SHQPKVSSKTLNLPPNSARHRQIYGQKSPPAMGKVKGKHRLDKFYHLAKEHGYRSRASWKLVQLDSKFKFLHSSRAVLDLCAAPGGWMQVAVEKVPVGSLVLGIDLVRIAPLRGALSIEQDITRTECRSKIKKIMGDHGVKAFDLVLHDGSPNIGGAWSQEATSQNALVIDAVKLATQFLAPKGNFVTKVFRSQDYNSVMYCLNQLFEKVEVDKPLASRKESAEIFLVGLKYKAPAKIDPRLLDFKHLFGGSDEPQRKPLDPLSKDKHKQKRRRHGYDNPDSLIRKVSPAADFIWSDDPLDVLGSFTSFTFEDPVSLPIKDHKLTTEEVKALCADLCVISNPDFKHLLKWRIGLRKALSPTGKATEKASSAAADSEEKKEVDEDHKLLNEMEELTYAMERKKKREKKIIAKRREKDKARKASGGMSMDVHDDGYTDIELFSLASIKGKKDLVAIDSAGHNDENGDSRDSDDEENPDDDARKSSSDADSDVERQRYDSKMEDFLDKLYERFDTKRLGGTKQRKRARQAFSDELLEEENNDMDDSDDDADREPAGREEANPLMMPLNDGEEPTKEEIANKWFAQEIFTKAAEEEDLVLSDSEPDDAAMEDSEPDDAAMEVDKRIAPEKAAVKTRGASKASKAEDDFEIVPAPETDSSDSSSDESEDDSIETKAEILACAKKMLRKKPREQILDDAYNKYMFDDEGLPGWFLEEERRHRKPVMPVTKEEMNAMRAQFKEINARPAKKVAQAKARKKRAAMRKLDKIKKKANAISDQTEISEPSKSKMIDKLYKNAAPKRPKKEYVVAKKGVAVKGGKGKVVVDRRMKKDVRGVSKKGKGGSKNGKGRKGSANKGGKGSASRGKAGGGEKERKKPPVGRQG